MDHYDGNTVTALWNYAQHYAMSDNDYQTNFGPEPPAAVNLVSGDTSGAEAMNPTTLAPEADPSAIGSPNASEVGTLYGDADPAFDECSDSNHTNSNPVVELSGSNIGTILDAADVTWGWFQGGFAPTSSNAGGAVCGSDHENISGTEVQDYVPSRDPFQYYGSTANPTHLPPSSEAAIGTTDQANHQYDLSYFDDTLADGNLPAVSFVEPPAYESGQPGASDPLDEQNFLASTINQIVQSSYWPSTARRTPSATSRPTRRRSFASSRTTGSAATASAPRRSTTSPAASTARAGCWTSPRRHTSISSSSIRRRARSRVTHRHRHQRHQHRRAGNLHP